MNNKAILFLIMALSTCLLVGCEDLYDGFYEMAFGKDMEITTSSVPAGRVGILYQWPIYAEVKNDPNDDAYDYDWYFTKGHLPEGLLFSDEGDNALISGIPMQSGIFDITIHVSSDRLQDEQREEDGNVWSSWSSKKFVMKIEEE